MKTLTAAETAETLGITPQRVRVLAKSRNLGRKHGRDWLFTERDLLLMSPRVVGRPRKEKG